MSIYTKRVLITIPSVFLDQVDKFAAAHFLSRSDLIRLALMEKMGLKYMEEKLEAPSKQDLWQAELNKIMREA